MTKTLFAVICLSASWSASVYAGKNRPVYDEKLLPSVSKKVHKKPSFVKVTIDPESASSTYFSSFVAEEDQEEKEGKKGKKDKQKSDKKDGPVSDKEPKEGEIYAVKVKDNCASPYARYGWIGLGVTGGVSLLALGATLAVKYTDVLSLLGHQPCTPHTNATYGDMKDHYKGVISDVCHYECEDFQLTPYRVSQDFILEMFQRCVEGGQSLASLISASCGTPVCPSREDFARLNVSELTFPQTVVNERNGTIVLHDLQDFVVQYCKFFGNRIFSRAGAAHFAKGIAGTDHLDADVVLGEDMAEENVVMERLMSSPRLCEIIVPEGDMLKFDDIVG
ncbi:hypothetical protein [Candidatus Hepatobacter penaei]|uniref:hypothetical protein n=1 Tax=Candidatus Hepatobacter penaei TaxID=1274402 RepID=UPI0012E0ABE3|nr:hypothetical protein [Candidatus Hepatobacter penaei]